MGWHWVVVSSRAGSRLRLTLTPDVDADEDAPCRPPWSSLIHVV